MEKSIQLWYKNRYPELASIKKNFTVLEQTLKIKTDEGSPTIAQKIIKISCEDTDTSLWEMLTKLKEETKQDEWIALHHINRMTPCRLRKMV